MWTLKNYRGKVPRVYGRVQIRKDGRILKVSFPNG